MNTKNTETESWVNTSRKKIRDLFYGDNLDIMSRYLGKDSVDLIYLDPPFNSQKNYNIMYSSVWDLKVPEQVEAFSDTWTLTKEKEDIARSIPVLMRDKGVSDIYIEFWRVWVDALRKTNPQMLAYLVYMVQRLLYMRSILSPTGSIYFHCDPTASHYIKVMMDGIFGHENFRNEIIWKRTSSHNKAARWGEVHDNILFYSKSDKFTWNKVHQELSPEYIGSKYRYEDERGIHRYSDLTAPGIRKGASGQSWMGYNPTSIGRHWAVPKRALSLLESEGHSAPSDLKSQLDLLFEKEVIRFAQRRDGSLGAPEIKNYLPEGQALQDVILDIGPLNSQSNERLGYPTQKPIALLERIIQTSTNEGDVVFDPFCGCGTTLYAAEINKRSWVGCDIAILPITIVRKTLSERYGLQEGRDYEAHGIPLNIDQAKALYEKAPKQFAHWAVEYVGGFPLADHEEESFDGCLFFDDSGYEVMPLQVRKTIRPKEIENLYRYVAERPGVSSAGVICLQSLSRASTAMMRSLKKADPDFFEKHRLQVLTMDDILELRKTFQVNPATHAARLKSEPTFL